jgi:hypothetical protein
MLYESFPSRNCNKAKEDGIGGHVARMEKIKNAYEILSANLKGGTTRRHRCRWEDNTKMDRREIG